MPGPRPQALTRQTGKVMPVLVTLAALVLVTAVLFLLFGERAETYLQEPYRQAEETAPITPPPPQEAGTREVEPEALMQLQPKPRRVAVGEAETQASPSPAPVPQTDIPLNESDIPVRNALLALAPGTALGDWLISEELIRKFVVTVDNIAKGNYPHKHSVLRPPSTAFRAAERNERFWLDGYNYSRYTPYMTVLAALDIAQLRDLYLRYYPLLQKAYAELGYPRRSFHDRFLEAIDYLLQSPVQKGPIELEQGESGVYLYADPRLEALSDVHKQVLRLGPANARMLLERLTLLRTELAQLDHG